MTLPADFPRPTPHEFERQLGAPNECAVCSLARDGHRTYLTELPELQTDGPLLPEDGIDYWHVLCPVCQVQHGSCVSTSGYYRWAHLQRLEKAREIA